MSDLNHDNPRIRQLAEWLAQEPKDPFLRYAMAIEYRQLDPPRALLDFEILMREHPEYTGTYYHAAALYRQMGRHQEARQTYERGLEICRQQQDRHALAELRRAYDDFLEETED